MTSQDSINGFDGGFITLHRRFLSWEWYGDINTKVLFIHCLFKANYEAKKWRGIVIERGQFISSVSNLSEETGLSPSKVRTAINKLTLTNEIAMSTTPKYSMFSITKYDHYQSLDKQDDKQMTNGSQTTDKQIANKSQQLNKVNNNNKVNKEEYSVEFETFWKAFPKRPAAVLSRQPLLCVATR